MKKLSLAVVLLAGLAQYANADTRSASATASWDAKAIKDTNSMLVVTPLKSLTFNYAEGLERFNTQDGAFDITVSGQSGASDFKLTSKLISNDLTRTSDNSKLSVGVDWNGSALTKNQDTVMIDTTEGIQAGLGALAQESAYAGSGRTSTQGVFQFSVADATVDGTPTEMKDLTDGYWDGNVNVEFIATWDGDFVAN